jgi:hypothetical protein
VPVLRFADQFGRALRPGLTARPNNALHPARDRAHLDKSLSRAQRRMTEAVRELARVRKLAVPAIWVTGPERQLKVLGPGK